MPDVLKWTSPAGDARSAEFLGTPVGTPARPAVAILAARPADLELARGLAARFEKEKWPSLLLDRSAASAASDREHAAEIEAALQALGAHAQVDPEALALIGIGPAGTQAFLCACASRRVAALVDLCGALVRAELNAAHPVQPLDMALNLTAPILIVHAPQDPNFGSADAEHAVLRLRRAMRAVEALQLPAGYPPGSATGYHPEQAGHAMQGITTFLETSFDAQ